MTALKCCVGEVSVTDFVPRLQKCLTQAERDQKSGFNLHEHQSHGLVAKKNGFEFLRAYLKVKSLIFVLFSVNLMK